MSRANVEVVRRSLASWSTGDIDEALRDADPEMVLVIRGVFPGTGGEYRGGAAVREFWRAFREPWESISIEPLEMQEVDDNRVLAVCRFRGRGRASGASTDAIFAFLWTFKGGVSVRLQSFATKADALEAVGLRE